MAPLVHCRQTRIGEAANDHTMAIATLYDIDNGLHEILDRYPTHRELFSRFQRFFTLP